MAQPLGQSTPHMRAVSLIVGERVAQCMCATPVSDVVDALKHETLSSTVCAKGDALRMAVRNDEVATFEVLSCMSPPENVAVQRDNGTIKFFPYAWECAIELQAARIFHRLLTQLSRHPIQRRMFALCKATDVAHSPLSFALQCCIDMHGAKTELFFVTHLLNAKFSFVDLEALFSRNGSGFNAYDMLVQHSRPEKHSGILSATADWTSNLLNQFHRAHAPEELCQSVTPSSCIVPNAGTLTLAVMRGNYYAVLMLTAWKFTNGVADTNKLATNELYAPAVAIVYALHAMHAFPGIMKQRVRVARHLILLGTTDVNQFSGTGRKGIAQNTLSNVLRCSAYSRQSLMSLCLLALPSHVAHFSILVSALLERKDLDLQAEDPSNANTKSSKTLLEQALEIKKYDLVGPFIDHVRRYRARKGESPQAITKNISKWVTRRWNTDALTNMQTLCAHADRIQQRVWHSVAKNRKCTRADKWESELQSIFKCIIRLMPLHYSHCQSIQWFVLSSHRTVADAAPRNANWVNMMFEFWHTSLHAQQPSSDDASTQGVHVHCFETVFTIVASALRIRNKKSSVPAIPEDMVLLILSMMSRMDLVPMAYRASIWPVTVALNKRPKVFAACNLLSFEQLRAINSAH